MEVCEQKFRIMKYFDLRAATLEIPPYTAVNNGAVMGFVCAFVEWKLKL
jgi:hypothetical protein